MCKHVQEKACSKPLLLAVHGDLDLIKFHAGGNRETKDEKQKDEEDVHICGKEGYQGVMEKDVENGEMEMNDLL